MALSMRNNLLSRSATRSSVARSRVVSVNAYKVTLKTPSGTQTIECPDDTYILVSGLRSSGWLLLRGLCGVAAGIGSSSACIDIFALSARLLCVKAAVYEQQQQQQQQPTCSACITEMLWCLPCRMLLRRLALTCPTAAVQVGPSTVMLPL